MADDITIVDYNPEWPAQFAREANRVRSLIGEPATQIEHHGSTAVPRPREIRDYLRTHPEVAAEYADLKRSLAGALGDDRHAYMSAKGDFINRITNIATR